MGTTLTLLPQNKERFRDLIFPNNRLEFTCNWENFFAQIAQPNGRSKFPERGVEAVIPTHPLPEWISLEIHDEDGRSTTREDRYGSELTYSLAGEMRKLRLEKGAFHKDKAIMAYVRALEPDTPIVLYWE